MMENYLCSQVISFLYKNLELEIAKAQVDNKILLLQPYYPLSNIQCPTKKDFSFSIAVHSITENKWFYAINMGEFFTLPLVYDSNNKLLIALLVYCEELEPFSRLYTHREFLDIFAKDGLESSSEFAITFLQKYWESFKKDSTPDYYQYYGSINDIRPEYLQIFTTTFQNLCSLLFALEYQNKFTEGNLLLEESADWIHKNYKNTLLNKTYLDVTNVLRVIHHKTFLYILTRNISDRRWLVSPEHCHLSLKPLNLIPQIQGLSFEFISENSQANTDLNTLNANIAKLCSDNLDEICSAELREQHSIASSSKVPESPESQNNTNPVNVYIAQKNINSGKKFKASNDSESQGSNKRYNLKNWEPKFNQIDECQLLNLFIPLTDQSMQSLLNSIETPTSGLVLYITLYFIEHWPVFSIENISSFHLFFRSLFNYFNLNATFNDKNKVVLKIQKDPLSILELNILKGVMVLSDKKNKSYSKDLVNCFLAWYGQINDLGNFKIGASAIVKKKSLDILLGGLSPEDRQKLCNFEMIFKHAYLN